MSRFLSRLCGQHCDISRIGCAMAASHGTTAAHTCFKTTLVQELERLTRLDANSLVYLSRDRYFGNSIYQKQSFEWGAGFSTLFWHRGQDRDSMRLIRSGIPCSSRSLALTVSSFAARDVKQYFRLIYDKNEFDVFRHGTGESRYLAAACDSQPAARGSVILDNSDLWLESSQVLRDSGLIQVDLLGLHQ